MKDWRNWLIILMTVGFFLINMTLKLFGVFTLSWWWVTLPLWLPALIVIGFLVWVGFKFITGYKPNW